MSMPTARERARRNRSRRRSPPRVRRSRWNARCTLATATGQWTPMQTAYGRHRCARAGGSCCEERLQLRGRLHQSGRRRVVDHSEPDGEHRNGERDGLQWGRYGLYLCDTGGGTQPLHGGYGRDCAAACVPWRQRLSGV